MRTRHLLTAALLAVAVPALFVADASARGPHFTYDTDSRSVAVPVKPAPIDAPTVDTGRVTRLPMDMAYGAKGRRFVDRSDGFVLTGFVIRSGDIIDGATPVYRRLRSNGRLGRRERDGAPAGGRGGGAHVVEMPGYVVAGVEYRPVTYYGHSAIESFRVLYKRWTRNGPRGPIVKSPVFSPGRRATHRVKLRRGAVAVGVHGSAHRYINGLSLLSAPLERSFSPELAAFDTPRPPRWRARMGR